MPPMRLIVLVGGAVMLQDNAFGACAGRRRQSFAPIVSEFSTRAARPVGRMLSESSDCTIELRHLAPACNRCSVADAIRSGSHHDGYRSNHQTHSRDGRLRCAQRSVDHAGAASTEPVGAIFRRSRDNTESDGLGGGR